MAHDHKPPPLPTAAELPAIREKTKRLRFEAALREFLELVEYVEPGELPEQDETQLRLVIKFLQGVPVIETPPRLRLVE